jgi:aerobic-type carbon monoxide dehydrogenase small subunit (CoxS/CutS family)
VTETISFRLNGVSVTVDEDPGRPLVDALRIELDVPSVRMSCGIGNCGTCTVLLDGRAVSGCLLLLGMVHGRDLETTEGSTTNAFREAFVDEGAFQCSFCIPAMVLTAEAACREQPEISLPELTEQLAGNLCRCGSYPQVRAALRRVLEQTEATS